ncbi:TOM70 protein, partial [Acromyrmex heyeri]
TPLQIAQKYKIAGNVHFTLGKYNEAIAQYNKAIDICPKENVDDLAIFYQNRAAAYEQLKKYNSVKADCTKALELNPKYMKALLRRARILEQLGDFEAALKDITTACIHENFSDQASLLKAQMILEKLVEQQARENLANKEFVLPSKFSIETCIASFPKDPVFLRLQHPNNFPQFFKKPLEALKNTEYDNIIPLCTEIIKSAEFDKLPPSKLEVLLLRATFYVLSGDYISAIQDFESILNSEDVSDDIKICVFVRRANLYMQLEMSEIAFKDFELAISINPRYGDIYYQRGQTYLLMERLCEAKRDFNKAVECDSNFGMAYLQTCYMDFSFAYNNMDIRLVKVAVKKLERAFKKFPNPPESIFCCNLYADIMSKTDQHYNFYKADACLVKAIQKYPEHAYVYETRGALQFKHDNVNKAIECFNKAIELDYKCEVAYKQLGKLEMQRGNVEKAVRLLDKASIICRSYVELLQIYIFRNFTKVQFDIKNELGSVPPILQLLPHLIAMEENLMEQSDWPKMIFPAVELKIPLQMAQKYNNVGNVYFRIGKQDEAIAQYSKAIDICPKENVENLAIFYQNRAAAYEQLKKYSSVKADCTKALELNPKYMKALLRRARVLEQIEDLDAAMKDLTIVCVHEGFSNHASLVKADEVLDKLIIQHAEESWVHKKLILPINHDIDIYILSFPKDPVFCRLQRPENIPEFFKKPLKALKDKEYDDIIPLCTEIIKSPEFDTLSSTKLEVLLLRATFYVLLGDYSAAIQDFENVLNNEDVSDDLRINALIKRAELYMRLKDSEMSFKDFELAISINSTCSDIYYHRGRALVFMDKENEAKLEFEKAIKYNPNFSNAYIQKYYLDYSIAISNDNTRLIRAAIKTFEKTFVKYPNLPEHTMCCIMYAEMMTEIKQYQKADNYLIKAMEKNPKCASVYANRSLLHLRIDNVDKAVEYINKAIEIDEKFGRAYGALGTIEVKRGNIEEAIRLFDKGVTYCKIFKEQLEIYNLREAAKIELYIKNQLGSIPCLFREFSRFIDIEIAVELLDYLIS